MRRRHRLAVAIVAIVVFGALWGLLDGLALAHALNPTLTTGPIRKEALALPYGARIVAAVSHDGELVAFVQLYSGDVELWRFTPTAGGDRVLVPRTLVDCAQSGVCR